MTQRRAGSAERGSGSVLGLAMCLLVVLAAGLAMVLGGWIGSAHQARNAADLAALSGAHALKAGAEPCAAAGSAAQAHGAVLLGCSVSTEDQHFAVRVRVQVELRPRLRGAPTVIHEDARAGTIR